jgi:hypothetical protein
MDVDQLKMLRDSLLQLSKSPEELRTLIPNFVVDIEGDIVSDFENAFVVLSGVLKKHTLTYESIIAILEINNMISIAMTTEDVPDDFFTNSYIWTEIRKKAAQVEEELRNL